ncbi:MAG TPA: SurA N-terminal domain-containing protein [Gaiellaceae bacterium]|nr:SurA N-terminal domain-containing protein [Gaiellaceae bacterium]
MTRLAVVAALSLALFAACGGGGDKKVAEVGGQQVTQQQLDALVQHFRRVAQQEGKDFPSAGTKPFVQLRNQLLGLLVYRTELKQAAKRLGVTVSDAQVNDRLAAAQAGGDKEGDTNGDTYARDTVEAELLKEGIAAKVTRGITGKTVAERSARRNAALATFLARLQRQTNVRYEPGYAPGS